MDLGTPLVRGGVTTVEPATWLAAAAADATGISTLVIGGFTAATTALILYLLLRGSRPDDLD